MWFALGVLVVVVVICVVLYISYNIGKKAGVEQLLLETMITDFQSGIGQFEAVNEPTEHDKEISIREGQRMIMERMVDTAGYFHLVFEKDYEVYKQQVSQKIKP